VPGLTSRAARGGAPDHRFAAPVHARPEEAAFEPVEVAPADQRERQRKSAYIDHVVREAPKILAGHGDELPKPRMRELLRQSFEGTLPVDEANAYGWGFRRLTEVGASEPASGSSSYQLRQR
jgi:hypothetical protein